MAGNKLEENFSVKQSQQLQLLKDNKKLEELKMTLLKLQKDEQKLTSLKDVLMKKKRNLETLLEKSLADEIKEEYVLKNKLGKVNHKSDQQGNLNILCKMGYFITESMVNEVNYVKINCKHFHVICLKDQSKYDVREIYPDHPNFRNIQQFLSDTQDLKGMLSFLREYFLDKDLVNQSQSDRISKPLSDTIVTATMDI